MFQKECYTLILEYFNILGNMMIHVLAKSLMKSLLAETASLAL